MATRYVLGMRPRAVLSAIIVLATVAWTPSVLSASDSLKGARKFNPDDQTVEIFSASEAGKLEVRLIPKDSAECRILITNKTDQPLNVSMPEVLAGVPVLAQDFADFDDDFRAPDNNRRQSNQPQPLGIGNPFNWQQPGNQQFFNLPGQQGPPAVPGFAPFNIAPEKVAVLRLPAVCLEHGRRDPRPMIPYQLRPLESVTQELGVRELCAMLAQDTISQHAAQAAAWHLNNHMSWDDLRAKEFKVLAGPNRPYFSKHALTEAQAAVAKATKATKKRKKGRAEKSLSASNPQREDRGVR